MAVCQNLVPPVNIKIAGKWMFIPLKMVLIGIDPTPYPTNPPFFLLNSAFKHCNSQALWSPWFPPRRWHQGTPLARRHSGHPQQQTVEPGTNEITIWGWVKTNSTPGEHQVIAGKWMFIPLKMVFIGIDPYPDHHLRRENQHHAMEGLQNLETPPKMKHHTLLC